VGKYEDIVLCDVAPMESCHVLLGKLWKFYKKTMHNGLNTEITFTHKEKKFVLHPLTQVLEDQVQMKNKLDSEKKVQKSQT